MSIQANNPIRPSLTPPVQPAERGAEAAAHVAPEQPAPNPAAFKSAKATRVMGGAADLAQLRTLAQSIDQIHLKTRITELQGSHFYNGLTRFLHKIFNSETYQAYRSEKALLREVSGLRAEAAVQLQHAQLNNDPISRARAELLNARADLLERPPLSKKKLLAAMDTLHATPEGLQELQKLAGLEGLGEPQLLNTASLQTTASLKAMNPIRSYVLSRRITPVQLAMNDLKRLAQTQTGVLGTVYARLNPTATLSEKMESYLFHAYTDLQVVTSEIPFLLELRRLSEQDPAPALADLQRLNDTFLLGADASVRVNLGGAEFRLFNAALERGDLNDALKQLSGLGVQTELLLKQDVFKNFKQFQAGQLTIQGGIAPEFEDMGLVGANYTQALERLTPHHKELSELAQTSVRFDQLQRFTRADQGFRACFYARFNPEATPAARIDSVMLEEFMAMQLNNNEVRFMHAMQRLATSPTPPTLADLQTLNADCLFRAAHGMLESDRVNVPHQLLAEFDAALTAGDQNAALTQLMNIATEVNQMITSDFFPRFEAWRLGQTMLHDSLPRNYREMEIGNCSYQDVVVKLDQYKPELGLRALVLEDHLQKSGLLDRR